MGVLRNILKLAVAAAGVTICLVSSALAEGERLQQLMLDLKSSTAEEAGRIAADIQLEWEKSGSASADLLLSRGQRSLEAGDVQAAIEHFTALTDHAPEFAEGWVSRASAFAHADMFGPALGDLEVALGLNPQHFEAIVGLATLLELINRPQDAYEAYQLVQSIHPHHPTVTEALERLGPSVLGREL